MQKLSLYGTANDVYSEVGTAYLSFQMMLCNSNSEELAKWGITCGSEEE